MFFIINLIIHYRNKPKVSFLITPFIQIKALSDYAKKIANLDDALNYFDLGKAHKKFSNLGLYQFLLASEKQEQNEFSSFIWLLVEYIKITFLLEVNLLDKCVKIADSSRQEIHDLFKYIGLIDTSISIASYRAGLDYYCTPEFDQLIRVKTEDMIHPLIDDCVPNSLDTNGKNVLITGSNMSGKTTFIRTVAVNVILAQSIYTVCAKFYRANFLDVSTSIGIADSLLLGKSYYLEELESVYNFIERSDDSKFANLFVMDELFKGTNTNERIAAGQAVSDYLSKGNNIVMVSTHDLELSKLLNVNYESYYFAEEVSDQGLHFDHKIKKGILSTRNAIKLLEYFDYPKEIIQSANTYIQSVETAK
ncbi:MutS-related protein, family 1 [Arcticibacter svalbardensis MN12-7]|uniref:MutS-related protein, family 1 n=1 Tax=Arcticibacter svalbardensis MN12-7 TaxID=1150600 RepID=R9GV14_9SPHI|nr:MutS-related protein, family 1 [Arcticibacter svalbardensis MN12-7]